MKTIKENLRNELPAAIYTIVVFAVINVAIAIAWCYIVPFCGKDNILSVMGLAVINIFAAIPVGVVCFITQFLFFPAFSIARKCREEKRVFVCTPLDSNMNALAYSLMPIAIAEIGYTTSVVLTYLMFFNA